MGEEVAVKLLDVAGPDVDKKRQLKNELNRVARLLVRCGHACRLLGVCATPDHIAIVSQRHDCSLAQYAAQQRGGRLQGAQAVLLAREILRALVELSDAGVPVLDLHPGNVLMSKDGVRVVISDVGLSRAIFDTVGALPQTAGEPSLTAIKYMSPERLEKGVELQSWARASAMWSFAATLGHVLTGQEPWRGLSKDDIAHQLLVEKRVPAWPPRLPAPLAEVLAGCFHPQPWQRPTAAEALRRIDAFLDQALGPDVDAPPPRPAAEEQAMQSAWVLSYVRLAESYKGDPAVREGPLQPGKYSIVMFQDQAGHPQAPLLVQLLSNDKAPDAHRWYPPEALQAVRRSEVPQALRLRPWRPADGKRGVPVCPGNARPGMLVQRGYQWMRPDDHNGKDGELGVLVHDGSADGQAWHVHWASGATADYHTGLGGKFELAHVQLHERGGSPVFEGDGSLPGAAVMRGYGWHWGSQDGEPYDIGSLEPCAEEGRVAVRWRLRKKNAYKGDVMDMQYDLSHAVRPGEPVTVFTAREGLPVVRGPAWKGGNADGGTGVGELLEPVRVTRHEASGVAGLVWRVRWANGNEGECAVYAEGKLSGLQHAPYTADGKAELGTMVRLAPGGLHVGNAKDGPLKTGVFRDSVGVVMGAGPNGGHKVMALRDRNVTHIYDRRALALLPGHWAAHGDRCSKRVTLNRDGRAAFPGQKGCKGGDTGFDANYVFYCGARMNQCRCGGCSGVCGPNAGCPCHACLELLGKRVGPEVFEAAGAGAGAAAGNEVGLATTLLDGIVAAKNREMAIAVTIDEAGESDVE